MDATPSHEERLRSNYSEIGIAVMQALYSDDYLSIGGVESTDELARLASISESSRVLDIGCGVGGPALHLASTVGCTIVGIDLVDTSINVAEASAASRGLSQMASFEQADATALPFPEQSFDVVIGQDAWCHIQDKPAMLAEVARVLRPAGTIAFTDWLVGTGMTPTERAAALEAALSTEAASADGYIALLSDAGFTDVAHVDSTATFVRQYQEICSRLDTNRAGLIDRFGERVYSIVADVNTKILHGFEGGAINGGRFVGTSHQNAQQ